MADWEDMLISALSERRLAASAVTSPAMDPLLAAFAAIVDTMGTSIRRVSEAVGAGVASAGIADDRVRWALSGRALSVRYDASTQRIFVSADVGDALSIEEFERTDGRIMDGQGIEASPEQIAQRFVPLLFDVPAPPAPGRGH